MWSNKSIQVQQIMTRYFNTRVQVYQVKRCVSEVYTRVQVYQERQGVPRQESRFTMSDDVIQEVQKGPGLPGKTKCSRRLHKSSGLPGKTRCSRRLHTHTVQVYQVIQGVSGV